MKEKDFYSETYESLYANKNYHFDPDFDLHSRAVVNFLTEYHNYNILRGKSVLDIGCSNGKAVHELSLRGFEAYGIDISSTAIDYCTARGLTNCKVGSAIDIPFDQTFDYVTCTDVLEHLRAEDIPAAIKEFSRVCEIGAILKIALVPEYKKFSPQPLHLSLLPIEEWNRLLHPHFQLVTYIDITKDYFTAFYLRHTFSADQQACLVPGLLIQTNMSRNLIALHRASEELCAKLLKEKNRLAAALAAEQSKNIHLSQKATNLNQSIYKIKQSKRYKIGKTILQPYELIKKILTKEDKARSSPPSIAKLGNITAPKFEWAEQNKHAIFLSLNEDYMPGFEVLIKSIRITNPALQADIIIMDLGLTQDSLEKIKSTCALPVFFIKPESSNYTHINKDRVPPHFIENYYKLDIFACEKYERIISIDADMLVVADISFLFKVECEIGAVAAFNSTTNQLNEKGYFNAGLLILTPSVRGIEKYKSLLEEASPGHKMAEQDLLNQYFHSIITLLPKIYNCEKRMFINEDNKEITKNAAIIHYVANKPWSKNKIEEDILFKDIEAKWWDVFYAK